MPTAWRTAIYVEITGAAVENPVRSTFSGLAERVLLAVDLVILVMMARRAIR